MKRLKIGIIGCGAIGKTIALYCAKHMRADVAVSALFDIDQTKAKSLREKLSGRPRIAKSIEALVRSCDLVLESASVAASASALRQAVALGKDIMIMSSGGIVNRQDLLNQARKKGCRVFIPSGAVIGLDGLKAASLEDITDVTLTTRKPAEGLKDAPYVVKNRIDLDSLKGETLIFEGSAAEAIKAFPKNINVSATLSMAALGPRKTRVRIISSPAYTKNIHEIEVRGGFGNFFARTENVPTPDNPKTSYMAVLSAIATLRGVVDSVRIGT